MRRPAAIVSLALVAVLVGLAQVLDEGRSAGLPLAVLEFVGRAYFALLVGAPLLVIPIARRDGATTLERLGWALLPGFLWWSTEVGVRLEWHGLAEAIWLACSPFNAVHLWLSLICAAIAESASSLWRSERFRGRTVALILAGLFAFPIAVGLTVFPYLNGYRALFQADLLPTPSEYVGPLDPATIEAPTERPPNVIFILSDDHRYDFAGYEGHPFVETPSLDRLANEGLRFDRAYVTSSLCSPSRASFLTGTYPHRHGVWNNFTPWSDENRTFLEYLKPAGYRTAFIGKWHMPGGLPDLRGVDHFVTFTGLGGQGVYEWCPLVVDGRDEPSRVRYIAEELTNRALEWLEEEDDRPFALYLSHKSVHADFTPDEPERGRYAGEAAGLPPEAHPWSHTTRAQYAHMNLTPLDDSIRVYAEAITSMDRQIGRVLDWLDEQGHAEDTVVIYTSDNGYQWGERGLVDKRWPYEESIRIPFLLRWPGGAVGAGARVPGIIANVDVAPTLLELAGLDVPSFMQGESLVPMLADPAARVRDAFLYAYYFEPPYPTPTAHAVVTEAAKFIDYDGRPDESYDLVADPTERANLGPESPLRALRQALEARVGDGSASHGG